LITLVGSGQFQYICINQFVDNALKFIDPNGTISVTVRIQQNEKNMEAIVSIKDNGTGIDPEVMPKLFTKFVTNSLLISGTKWIGLGLYISRNITEAHVGRIWAENNTKDIGATFSFSLLMVK
jgi:signal transduction histidine kinase